MNKYLVKLAGKLPSEVKHWVRQRLKVDMPKVDKLNNSKIITPEDRLGRKDINRSLAKLDRATSRLAKSNGDIEGYHYGRGNAIIRRVMGAGLKGK